MASIPDVSGDQLFDMLAALDKETAFTKGSICLSDEAYAELVELWILRVMLRLGAHKSMLFPTRICDDEVFMAIGLGILCQQESKGEYDHPAALKLLSARLEEAEVRTNVLPFNTPLEKNLTWLACRLGLSKVETAILRFVVLSEDCEHLSTVLDRMGNLSLQTIQRMFALVLELPETEVAAVFRPDSTLMTCGLVSIDNDYRTNFKGKVELLKRLSDQLFNEYGDPMHMLRERVVPGNPPKLVPADYSHAADDLALLHRYLSAAKGQDGVNILVYGPPGTGKTEFVRMLASMLDRPLYEVATQEKDSSPLSGSQRLLAFRLAQHMLRNEREAIILFDEIEDVFRDPDGAEKGKRTAAGKKAWMNQLLETNPVPSFWLSNSIHAIDNAITRRFDYVFCLETPPRKVRVGILNRYFEQVQVSQNWVENLSEHENLAPAVVERAAKVAASLNGMPEADIERVATRILSGTLEAMGLQPIRKAPSKAIGGYRLECINTDPPISTLPEKLAAVGQARLCLYGPPGTGKTAFGRYLADALQKRLIVKRASDLLSPYVGVAEKMIAQMFAEAADENAVLLLDEADSFLQERSRAVRSWEISQVNEMLTQMEQFEGIFVASTNFMDSLDTATLRRFDLKIHFDWMRPDQIEQLFADSLRSLNLPPDPFALSQARSLEMLTPGDFANVLRQTRLRVIDSATTFYDGLAAEVAAKSQGKALGRIGF